jgi:hypothetical protein
MKDEEGNTLKSCDNHGGLKTLPRNAMECGIFQGLIPDCKASFFLRRQAKRHNRPQTAPHAPILGSVSKVEMTTPMALIYKVLFPSISTFEAPPNTRKPEN